MTYLLALTPPRTSPVTLAGQAQMLAGLAHARQAARRGVGLEIVGADGHVRFLARMANTSARAALEGALASYYPQGSLTLLPDLADDPAHVRPDEVALAAELRLRQRPELPLKIADRVGPSPAMDDPSAGLQRVLGALRRLDGGTRAVCQLILWPGPRRWGAHPLLHRFALAAILKRDPFDTWALLRTLRDHGLCQTWRPRRCGHAWRYSLTTRGTTLLAHAAGLAPADYRHLYGVLDDARRSGEHGLAYARENIEHTDGISAAYLSVLEVARARGGDVRWHGEWACARTYRVRDGRERGVERKDTLRPDAELRYAGPGGPFRAFVEVDRDNESARELAGKVRQYDDYRADSGDGAFAVLLLTRGPGRGDGPLAAAWAIARERRVPVLDLRTTTAAALAAAGPWAPIWRDVYGRRGPINP